MISDKMNTSCTHATITNAAICFYFILRMDIGNHDTPLAQPTELTPVQRQYPVHDRDCSETVEASEGQFTTPHYPLTIIGIK